MGRVAFSSLPGGRNEQSIGTKKTTDLVLSRSAGRAGPLARYFQPIERHRAHAIKNPMEFSKITHIVSPEDSSVSVSTIVDKG